MNFTPELLTFQGAIISADKSNKFSRITGRGGNEEAILDIVTKLFNFLQESNCLTKNGITETGKCPMRIYCFYLILNSDIPILDELTVMSGIESVINTVPKINQNILCDLIWSLNMEEYLKEIIIYSHPCLVTDLLKQFVVHLKYGDPTKCYNRMNLLASSCYKFICRLNFYDYSKDILIKILEETYDNFLTCINYYYVPPNVEKLNRLTEDEQYILKGRYLHNILLLIQESFGHYLTAYKFKSEGFNEIYLCTIDPNIIKKNPITNKICETENKLLFEYILKFNGILLDKCQALVMDVSVQIFCTWSEFEEQEKSMQQTIKETCYTVNVLLNKVQTVSDHPLLSILPQLSCKPIDFHDIINSSDENTIIENASKESEDRKYWVEAILNIDNFMKTKEPLEILLENINLLDISNCIKLFHILSLTLAKNDLEFTKNIKSVAIKAFVRLPDDTKVELTDNYFGNEYFNDKLECDDFHNMVTELFNKLSVSPDWNVNDVYNIFIQNPFEVFLTVFRLAINSSRKCDVMFQIVTMLKRFTNHYYSTDTHSTILKALLSTLQNGFETDTQIDNCIHFIINLKKGNIISEAKLLMLVIMPELHKALLRKDLRVINLYIKLLKEGYELEEMIKYRAPLLAMVAQVMEVTRWTSHTFVADAPLTLEETLELQMRLFRTYESQIPENEANWLRSKLGNLQPLNMYYYKELWNPPGDDYLEIVSGGRKLNTHETVLLLAKVCCVWAPREWAAWWRAASMRGPSLAASVLSRSLAVVTTLGTPRPLLLYAFTNFATLLKNNLLRPPLSEPYVSVVLDAVVLLADCACRAGAGAGGCARALLPLVVVVRDNTGVGGGGVVRSLPGRFADRQFGEVVAQLLDNTTTHTDGPPT